MQRQTAGVLEVRGPPPEGSPWQKIADGGKTIGTKAARTGQATAGAFMRFDSAIGWAFGGGP